MIETAWAGRLRSRCSPRLTAASDRFAQLNHAVDALGALPSTGVYLDGTHSGWLNVGDISDRLLKAGVQRADGFFLNASNYQFTANLAAYGRWISSCIEYVTAVNPGAFGDCIDIEADMTLLAAGQHGVYRRDVGLPLPRLLQGGVELGAVTLGQHGVEPDPPVDCIAVDDR